jgi:hypothetical protein
MKYLIQFKKYNEGVGDKYAEKHFGIDNEFSNFEKDYKMMNLLKNKEQIIFQNKHTIIIKNPKSLKNIEPNVRGVIDNDGNLYIEKSPYVTHSVLLIYLSEKGIIPYFRLWHITLPTDFITVQRYSDTNIFALGESNEMLLDDDDRFNDKNRNVPTRKESLPIFNKYLEKARKINPHINFINKRINYEIS